MRLEREDGQTWNDPSPETIEEVVGQLGQPDTAFVILDRDDGTFIQAGADKEGNCDLEYSQGSDDTHVRCTDEALPVQKIVEAFKEYAAGSDAWRDRFEWKPLSEFSSDGKKGCLPALLIIALGVTTLILCLT